MSNSYDSIQVLSDIQHIQRRKNMYIGDAVTPEHLITEVMDNSCDEVQGGYSDSFDVFIDTKKNEYKVVDRGRGIPHGKKTLETGEVKEMVEIICTKSNSGGKFDNENYKLATGLHGLGLTITNALSSHMEISSRRKGAEVKFISDNGVKTDLIYSKTNDHDGTTVLFIPNKEFFDTEIIPQKFVINKCRILNALGFKSNLFIDNDQIDVNYKITDLISEENENVSTYHDFNVFNPKTPNGEYMKVFIRYTSETNDRYFGYTNTLYNSSGGTHISEISKCIVDTWLKFIEKNKNLKPSVDLRRSDYLVGLRCICALFISEPAFSSQTKERLKVDKSKLSDLMEEFSSEFYKTLEDNIVIAQSLIKRFEEYRIAQDKLLARKEISSLIKINNDSPDSIRRRSVVPKLIECTSKKRDNTELFIVEGDSAAGAPARARNKELQAVLPLRGKILNVTNMDAKQAVKSQEVCNICNSIGCGLGSQCDSSKSRYERIIICADADPDGKNIECLVLSVFINMLPDIVKDGRLYISMPPLYGWQDKKGYHYSNNRDEIPKGIKFTRYKGLGEMDDDEYKYCCMDPDTRLLYRVEYPSDVERFNKILGTSVGKSDLMKELDIIKDLRDK